MVTQFELEAVGRVTDRTLLIHGGIGYARRIRSSGSIGTLD
jgi:hypothetical protein